MKPAYILVALFMLALFLLAPSQQALQGLQFSKEERELLAAEVDRISEETNELRRAGKWQEAYELCLEEYQIEVDLYGPRAWDVAGSHQFLAEALEHLGRTDEAREHLEMVVDIAGDFADKPWYMVFARGFMQDFEARCAASPGDRQRLYAAEATSSVIKQFFQGGRSREALPLTLEQLEARTAVYGEYHVRTALAMHSLGMLHVRLREFSEGEAYWERTLEIRRQLLGEEDPLTGESLNNLAVLLVSRGQHFKALPLIQTSVGVLERTRGTDSSGFRLALGVLHLCLFACQDIESAEAVAIRWLQLTVDRFGVGDRRCVEPMVAVAKAQLTLGRYGEANRLLMEALGILRSRRRPDSVELISCLANLSVLRDNLGDVPGAREFLDEALELAGKGARRNTANYAVLLNNLSALEMQLGDTDRGISALREVLEITRQDIGQDSLLYFNALNNLAVMLSSRGEWEEAFALAEEARTAFAKNNDRDNPSYALALGNQLTMYAASGDLDRAWALGKEALEIARGHYPELNPRFIRLLVSLGVIVNHRGDAPAGRAYLEEALVLAEKWLDPRHQDRGVILSQLARLALARGEPKLAVELYERALDVYRRNLELLASAQSERQQLTVLGMARELLDEYLTMAPAAGVSDRAAYAQVMAWKGSVFARQSRLRFRFGQPQLAETFAELQQVTDHYASLALAAPADQNPEAREQLAQLEQRREVLERKIAKSVSEGPSDSVKSPKDLQESLPPGVALVDFLVFERGALVPAQGESAASGEVIYSPHLTAFILRNDSEIKQVDLGPYQPVAQAIAVWRGELLEPEYNADGAAQQLRTMLWKPLEAFLGESETVLLSPDGAISRMPFAVLPGSTPESFLVEDVALGVVAAPYLIPQLLAHKPEATAPSLLTLGAINFDAQAPGLTVAAEDQTGENGSRIEADAMQANVPLGVWRGPGESAGSSTELAGMWPFGSLPGSRSEVDVVAGTFQDGAGAGTLRQLDGAAASEAAFRELVPNARYVHLATHGFFAGSGTGSVRAEPVRRSAFGIGVGTRRGASASHPGLLSGIVLAGANVRRGARGDDGLITAIEMATLDLSGVELMTLSACETGLGAAASGEGLLGIQRAAQISGAHSVLASLWKVQDQAASDWMDLFYTNLWHRGLSRLDALRQVQLTRIRQREHPRHWGAWVLSGDWR